MFGQQHPVGARGPVGARHTPFSPRGRLRKTLSVCCGSPEIIQHGGNPLQERERGIWSSVSRGIRPANGQRRSRYTRTRSPIRAGGEGARQVAAHCERFVSPMRVFAVVFCVRMDNIHMFLYFFIFFSCPSDAFYNGMHTSETLRPSNGVDDVTFRCT